MKRLTRLVSQYRGCKKTKCVSKSSLGVVSLFNAISSLPNELLLSIIRNIYPPGAFRIYNPYTNRGTFAFWDMMIRADRLMVSISQISEQFRKISAVILEELARATKAILPKYDSWKTLSDVHRKYREDSEWQWGYSVVCGYS